MANIWRDVLSPTKPTATIPVEADKSTPGVEIADYSVVGSYSWSGTPANPVVIIPGVPKAFVNWKGGQLRQTKEQMMVDENHYMNTKFPLEALIRSVNYCNDDKFDWKEVDVCTDRNNFRKLYAVAEADPEGKDEIRIDVERIGRTVMFTRWEPADQEYGKFPTYGKDFERVCTKTIDNDCHEWRCISTYSFAGLKVITRFEVDCVDYNALPRKQKDDDVDALAIAFQKRIDLSEKSSETKKFESSSLSFKLTPPSAVKFVGQKNPPLMELTTRAVHRGFPTEKWVQMYFSGTQTLVLGKHSRGHVQLPETWSLKQIEDLCGGKPVGSLKVFASMLRAIVAFVRENKEGELFSIVWKKSDGKVLPIYRRKEDASTRVAPENLLVQIRPAKTEASK